jgi:hypothetical protein
MSWEFIRDEVDKKKDYYREKFRETGSQVFDRTQIKGKKPGFYYRGWNKDSRRLAEAKSMGYEVCKEERWECETAREGGASELNEQIAMRISHEKLADNVARDEVKQELREAQVAEDYLAQAKDTVKTLKRGRRTIDESAVAHVNIETGKEVVGPR